MGDLLFYGIAGLVYLFSFVVQKKLKSTYARWSRVRNLTNKPGGLVARTILDTNGLQSVRVDPVEGTLTDHYDPRVKQIRLAQDNLAGTSVAARATVSRTAMRPPTATRSTSSTWTFLTAELRTSASWRALPRTAPRGRC